MDAAVAAGELGTRGRPLELLSRFDDECFVFSVHDGRF